MRSTKKYSKRKQYGRTKKNRRVRRYRGGSESSVNTLTEELAKAEAELAKAKAAAQAAAQADANADADAKTAEAKTAADTAVQTAQEQVTELQARLEEAKSKNIYTVEVGNIDSTTGKTSVNVIKQSGGRRRKSAHRRRTRRRKH